MRLPVRKASRVSVVDYSRCLEFHGSRVYKVEGQGCV